MSMLGFSVFLHHLREETIKVMAAAQFKHVFTTLQLYEENDAASLQQLATYCADYQLTLTIDVSPPILETFSIDDLKQLNVQQLRLDDGFSHEQMIALAEHFKLVLNASTIQQADIEALLNAHIPASQLAAWHNYYPHIYTGLSRSFFQQQNKMLKQFDIQTGAFIPGDEYRAPLFEGLPTLEKHRQLSPFASFLDIQNDVDVILIGDYSINESSMKQFQTYAQQIMPLRVTLARNYASIASRTYHNRPDNAEAVIRFLESRLDKKQVPAEHIATRELGAITINNDQFGRYEGEVQICRTALPLDERVNVIGQVIAEDIPLLSFIRENQAIQLEITTWI